LGNVAAALGLQLQLQTNASQPKRPAQDEGWWPVRIALSDYPQLKSLSWQVQGTDYLTPVEACGIYEHNARHLDMAAMTADEQALCMTLQAAFDKKASHV
jgi:hypothetical protein